MERPETGRVVFPDLKAIFALLEVEGRLRLRHGLSWCSPKSPVADAHLLFSTRTDNKGGFDDFSHTQESLQLPQPDSDQTFSGKVVGW